MGAPPSLELSPRQARRIAVRAQLLAAPRPGDVLEVVRHLGFLQVDLTRVVAQHADLALWTRLGSAYEPEDLEELVGDGALVELRAMLLPSEDVALHRADMDAWPGEPPLKEWQEDVADWVAANDGCRRDILALLRAEGPTAARDLPDTCEVPWRSTGWTNDKNVMKLLECLEARGEVAVASREGRERRWDLAERVHPGDPAVPVEEAHQTLAARRLRALGIARPRALEAWDERYDVRGTGAAARIDGVRGRVARGPRPGGRPRRLRGPHRDPLPAGPAGLRPEADGGPVRLRLPAGDVQARSVAPVGLLGDAGARRRRAGRQGRRDGRP